MYFKGKTAEQLEDYFEDNKSEYEEFLKRPPETKTVEIKNKRRKNWSIIEKKKYFSLLRIYGNNQAAIAKFFPNRNEN